MSDSVLKPDFYESSFIVSKNNLELPTTITQTSTIQNQTNYNEWIIPIILITIIIGIAVYVKKKYQSNP